MQHRFSPNGMKELAAVIEDWEPHPACHERVAIFVGDENGEYITNVLPIPNRAEDPTQDFAVMLGDVLALLSTEPALPHGARVMGCVHTHEDPGDMNPSHNDFEAASKSRAKYVHAIYNVHERTLTFHDAQSITETYFYSRPARFVPMVKPWPLRFARIRQFLSRHHKH